VTNAAPQSSTKSKTPSLTLPRRADGGPAYPAQGWARRPGPVARRYHQPLGRGPLRRPGRSHRRAIPGPPRLQQGPLASGAEIVLCCPAMAMRAEPLSLNFAVTNFGPLARAEIDLRPLTIFVGPSNTGKSYMAILIYAFLRSWESLHYFESRHFDFESLQKEKVSRFKKESEELQEIVENMGRTVMLSDFPDLSQNKLREMIRDRKFLGDVLAREMMRCFDVDPVDDLIRSTADFRPMKIIASRSRRNKPFWEFSVSAKNEEFDCDGDISNFSVFDAMDQKLETNIQKLEAKDRKRMRFLMRLPFAGSYKGSRHFSARREAYLFEGLASSFEGYLKETLLDFGDVHYLPAARSGIMQAHRVITSSLVARSARAGFERIQLPTLSGVIADFLQKILFYKENRRTLYRRARRISARVANSMENNILSGKIRAEFASTLDYPSFVYRPKGVEQDIGLARTSSMVAELAPIVLFLRGHVFRGDVLIVEEPEAHLHPAAQTKLAAVLAELVRNDVKVIITTHSEWLLQEISNLMREGQLRKGANESEEAGSPTLRPEEVGAWLFQQGEGDSGSTVQELKFDSVVGISPPDYEDVDLALYSRSAKLQDQLQVREHRPGLDYKSDTQDKEKP